MRKTIFTILGLLMLFAFVNSTFAQVPQGFNYQAVARNSSGFILQSTALGVKLSIHQGSAGGTVVYSERHTPSTNQFGLFTVTVGQPTSVLSGTFSTIDWSTGNYWLQVELDVLGGTTYTDMGTSKLQSVPYAMYAANGTTGPQGATGPTGSPSTVAGPTGPTGVTGPLVTGTSGQTLRHNGTSWIANSFLYNTGQYIGINTTNPLAALHIKAINNQFNSGIYLEDDATTNTGAILNGSEGLVYYNMSSADHQFYTTLHNGLTDPAFIIKNSGNVGIGTNNPGYKLDINGNARISGSLFDGSASSGGNGYVLTSTGTATKWVNNSFGFSAFRITTQTVDAATMTDIIFTATDYVDGSGFNTSTGEYTAPVAGVYHFDANVLLNGTASAVMPTAIYFYVNGLFNVASRFFSETTIFSLNISKDIKLSPGDVVKVRVYCNQATSVSAQTNHMTFFTGHKVY
jgi:hypothetical protein